MKREDIYRDWIEARKQTEAHPNLVENVMKEVHRAEPIGVRRASAWMRLIEWIDGSMWAKAAAISAAGVVGIGRVLLGIHLLLTFRLLGV